MTAQQKKKEKEPFPIPDYQPTNELLLSVSTTLIAGLLANQRFAGPGEGGIERVADEGVRLAEIVIKKIYMRGYAGQSK
jgi:hypothetical protein